jgi:peptidoglycan DL-endopeptidase CwlO
MSFTAAIEAQLQRLGEPADGAIAGHETALGDVHATLTEAQTRYDAATRTAMGSWEGAGSGEANSRASTLATAIGTASDAANATLGILHDAVGRVGAGRTEIQAMIDEFTRWAQCQIAIMQAMPEPARAVIGAGIWTRANETAGRAGEVVVRVDGELCGLAGQLRGQDCRVTLTGLDAPLTQAAPAPTAPAGATAPPLAPPGDTTGGGSGAPGGSSGSGFSGGGGGTAGGGGGTAGGGGGTAGGGGGHDGGLARGPALPTVQPIPPGSGVEVGLPGGGTAEAPNEIAANAVRYALQQVGVPYVWGASNPGAGFDCSGLTSWAYEMAGLEIPRHSAEQAIGAAVPPDQLLPGDLVVWQGHVAMVIGDGMMVEAGDPVQVSPIRTSNLGMQFLGFYRPTG